MPSDTSVLDGFYSYFAVFITAPWLAVLPVALFYWLYTRTGLRIIYYTSLLWLFYLVYELGIWFGLFCDPDCNIRVELLIIYPLLAVVSLVALLRALWTIFRGNARS